MDDALEMAWMSEKSAGIMDGYYRIRFGGLALNGRATILLKDGHIYGIKGEGQYDLSGRYSRQAKDGATEIELEVHTPGGTLDVSKGWLRPQPEVVTLKFALPDETLHQVVLATADGLLTVSLQRLQSPAPEQRGLEHL
jgi:hypothetical protein